MSAPVYIYSPDAARVQSINGKKKRGQSAPVVGCGIAIDTFFKKRTSITNVTRNFFRTIRKICPKSHTPGPRRAIILDSLLDGSVDIASIVFPRGVLYMFWLSHRQRLNLSKTFAEWKSETDIIPYLEFIKK